VVLSACYSAGGKTTRAIMGAPASMPLAVELVRGGVPVVIAMAGRVSDVGCRMFTRRFGEAVLKGEGLIVATAEARRASFQAMGIGKMSAPLDWALPVVFLSAQMDRDYVAYTEEAKAESERIRNLIKTYGVRRYPIFCARHEFTEAYDELFRTDERPVLAAHVETADPGLGRTRLLQELTTRALQDGHVPCLVSSDRPSWTPPKDITEFGAHLLAAVNTARTAFKRGTLSEQNSELVRLFVGDPQLAAWRDQPAKLCSKIFELFATPRDNVRPASRFSVADLKAGLQTDLHQLLQEIRAAYPKAAMVKSRALVLLDEVERYDKALSPLLHDVLDDFGLGTSEEVVRVVLVGSLATPAQHILWPWLEQGKPWLKKLPLSRFQENGEDMLGLSACPPPSANLGGGQGYSVGPK
jgi:hypothetical protein